MSILETIREKYLWVISAAIVVSLVGFILMDSRQGDRGNTGAFSDNDEIGSVNGSKITYGKYKEQSENASQYYESQGRPVDEQTRQQIGQQVWNQLIEQNLVQSEIDKLGFVITDKQLSDEMFVNDPPPFLKQQFSNQQGQFDAAAARQALNQVRRGKDEALKNRLESALNDYINGLLAKKYFTLLQQSAYVPKWMVQKSLADNNSISTFQYVTVPYSSISDSAIKISDDQISDYVKAHADIYKQDEPTRSISYVTFDIQPNASDSNRVYEEINGMKAAFQNASDPAAFLQINQSEQPYTNSYVPASRITGMYKDTMLAAGAGMVFGPYLENNAWTLSRIVDQRNLPDSVKARHILISTLDPQSGQPIMDDATAKAKIDSIYDQLKAGADFGALALQYSDDPGSKIKGGDLGYFGQGMMVAEFNDSTFLGKPGDYKIVKTQFGYHLIHIQEQKGSSTSYKIAYMARPIVPSQQTVNEAYNRASQFAGNSRNLKQFKENTEKNKYQVLSEASLREMDFNISGVGSSRQLVQWVFDNDKGDVSEVFEISNRYVVAAITGVEDAGLPSAAKVRQEVEPLLRNKEKAKQIIAKIGKQPASLEAVATAQQQTVQQADSISFANPLIPATGTEPKVVGWSFNKAGLNKVSPAIDGSTGVYVIKPLNIAARAGMMSAEEMKTQLESQMKQTLGYGSVNSLRKAAKVKDNRSKYL